MEKKLKVYLNSEKIFDKTIKNSLDSFVIDKNFLQKETFGKAGRFAGQLTDLNIWSRILSDSEIKTIYLCELLDEGPDVFDWKSSEFFPGRSIVVSEERPHPCIKNSDVESQTMIYDVELSMEPAMKPLRVCDSLGGRMDPLTSIRNGEKLWENCKSCSGLWDWVWVPIFKESEEKWVDREKEVVQDISWTIGQPNVGDHKKCAAFYSETTLIYIDTVCDNENKFYCKIKDFQVFLLKVYRKDKKN